MTSQPVVLITGALTGIGRATAFAFARDKARIVVYAQPRDPAAVTGHGDSAVPGQPVSHSRE